MIKKPEDAVPRLNQNQPEEYGEIYFTAAECAEVAKAYGKICMFTRKVHYLLKESEQGSKRRRRLYGLWNRCILARQAWEEKFAEWEKGQ